MRHLAVDKALIPFEQHPQALRWADGRRVLVSQRRAAPAYGDYRDYREADERGSQCLTMKSQIHSMQLPFAILWWH